jgi:multiple sugar transport system permease protein
VQLIGHAMVHDSARKVQGLDSEAVALTTGPALADARDGRRRKPRRSPRQRRDARTAYLLLAPAFVLFLVFIVIPLLGAVALSLFNYDLLTPPVFIGLANYRYLLHDQLAADALVVTFIFTAASVILHVAVGLGLALAVSRPMPRALRYGLRTAFFFPLLISWAVVSLIALYTLDPNFGFITYYLGKLGLHHLELFTNTHTALATIIGVDLWHTVGFSFIVLLAGLQSIPASLIEAARIDGAGWWAILRRVKLPLLSPSLFFVTVISFIGAFQIFEPVHIITDGGPNNSTESIVQYIYDVGFSELHMGYAATLGLVVFIVLLVVTLGQFALGRLWVHNDLAD